MPRAVSQYGDDGIYRVESAKMLAIVLHLLKGTPYVYQGEELGMTNCKVEDIAEVDDIESRNMYFEEIEKGTPKEELINRINKKEETMPELRCNGTEPKMPDLPKERRGFTSTPTIERSMPKRAWKMRIQFLYL